LRFAASPRIPRLAHCIAASLLTAGFAFADTPSAADDEDKKKMEPKVAGSATVTVTAEATTIDLAKTPNPVLVLDAERLQLLGTDDLARTLNLTLPGRTTTSGGIGATTSVFMNGARSQDTVILLDGLRVSSGNLGIDPSNFLLSGIERVEILSGAASTLYGGDAHGGVISLFSAAPSSKKGLSGFASLRTDTLGQARAGTSVSYGWEGSWLQGAFDAERSPQATETRNPYRHTSGHLGYGLRLGENSLLTLNYRQQYRGTPLPLNWGYGGPPDYAQVRAYDYEREYSRWQSVASASLRSAFTSSLYGEINVGNISQENYYTNNNSKYTLDMLNGNALLAWKQGRGGLTLLVDYNDEEYWDSYMTVFNMDTYEEETLPAATARHTAVVVEGSVEPVPALRFVASVRQQSDDISRPGESDASISQATWKVGVNFLAPSGFRAYANTGTAFNAPSLYALRNNAGVGKPTPGNEESSSVLGGVGYERPGWWVRADASRISYSNVLVWTYDPAIPDFPWFNGYYDTQKDIRVQGLEVSGGMRRSDWNAELFVRSQEGRDMTRPKEEQLKWFMSRPFFSAGLNADCALKKTKLGLTVSYIGHRYVYHGDKQRLDPASDPEWPTYINSGIAEKTHFIDSSAYATMQFGKNLTATLRAERLFQDGISREDWENYKDLDRNNVAFVPGYPVPGRSLGLAFRYRFN